MCYYHRCLKGAELAEFTQPGRLKAAPTKNFMSEMLSVFLLYDWFGNFHDRIVVGKGTVHLDQRPQEVIICCAAIGRAQL